MGIIGGVLGGLVGPKKSGLLQRDGVRHWIATGDIHCLTIFVVYLDLC